MLSIPNRQAEIAYMQRAMEIASARSAALDAAGELASHAKATVVLNEAVQQAYREAMVEYERGMAQHRALPFFQRLKATAPSKPMDPSLASLFMSLALPSFLEHVASTEERVVTATARIQAAERRNAPPAAPEPEPAHPSELDKKLAILADRKRELTKLDQALGDGLITAEDAQLLLKNIHDRAQRRLEEL